MQKKQDDTNRDFSPGCSQEHIFKCQLGNLQKQDDVRKLIVTGQVDHGQGATDEGIQTEVVAMSGDLVPMLVNMARMEVAGRYWVVLDMQDLRNHHKSQDTVLEVCCAHVCMHARVCSCADWASRSLRIQIARVVHTPSRIK